MEVLDTIIQRRKKTPVNVVFSEALDERVLRAARFLLDNQLAKPLLLGGPYEVRDFAGKIGLQTRGLKIIHPLHHPRFEEFSSQLEAAYGGSGFTLFDIREWLRQPLVFGAMLLKNNAVDLCISGNQMPSSAVLKTALRLIGLKEKHTPLSGFYLMVGKEGKPLYALADCTVMPRPTSEQLAKIALQTADNFTRLTGHKAKVALLSFSTAGSAKHELAEKMRRAADMARQWKPELPVDGEIQFDAAVVPQVAEKKAPQSSLKGEANVFIFPSLAAADIGRKLAERLAGFRAIGAFLQGLRKPLHNLSRGCATQTVIDVVVAGKEVR